MIKYILIAVAVIFVLTITIFIFEYTDIPEAIILMLYLNPTPHIAENSFVHMSTDKAVYLPGEPIIIKVKNISPYRLESNFPNYGIYIGSSIDTQQPCSYGGNGEAMSYIEINDTFVDLLYVPFPNCKDIRICHDMYAIELSNDDPFLQTHLCVDVTIRD